MREMEHAPDDDSFIDGISAIVRITPERYYYDEGQRLVDEGVLSIEGAKAYFDASLAHHYHPTTVPEPRVDAFTRIG